MLWLTPEVLRRSSVVSLGSATESARLHRHFFAKLERGEPVTILGVGSSDAERGRAPLRLGQLPVRFEKGGGAKGKARREVPVSVRC